jgi:hypothetical protein
MAFRSFVATQRFSDDATNAWALRRRLSQAGGALFARHLVTHVVRIDAAGPCGNVKE